MAGSSDSEGEEGPETRSKMLKRHKKEAMAAQKAAQRLGKKRADDAAALIAEVNARHAAELAALEARAEGGAAAPSAGAADAPAAAAGADAAAASLAAASLAEGSGAAPAGAAPPEAGGSKARQRHVQVACAHSVGAARCDPLARLLADVQPRRQPARAEAVQGAAAARQAGQRGGARPAPSTPQALLPAQP